ncbi:hypothetical protein BDN72DRAFT_847461 [Pluteus cervinus]|uniref:Uncharacterized protein n=1 Tax=Pluteus cervinus TaxID=181527 RepID=A0ACD3ACI0_9AGAR|nr:hypothetical protein BDN72DRAFT_847461 [Pluteus cervinus]
MLVTPDLPQFNPYGLTENEIREKIDQEVLQLKERISVLNTFRNTLAPVSGLPTEVLSEIFLHLLKDTSIFEIGWNPVDPVTVTRVCRRWRHTALTIPQLWATIADKRSDVPIRIDQIEAYIQRSRTTPLSVHLWNPSASALGACLAHIPRLRKLKLVGDSIDQQVVDEALAQPAPLLAALELEAIILPPSDLFSGVHPNLRSLLLDKCLLPFSSGVGQSLVSSAKITRLHLIYHSPLIAAEHFSKILISLQNLKELRLVASLDHRAIPHPQTLPRIALHNLEIIKIEEDSCEVSFKFLEWLDIPAACISILPDDRPDWEALCSGFSTYQQQMPGSFDIRNISIRGEPGQRTTLNISSDEFSHRYSFQLKDTNNPARRILQHLDISQVTSITLDSTPLFGLDSHLLQLDFVETFTLLPMITDPEDLEDIVALLSPDDDHSEDDEDEDDEKLCLFPKLKELTIGPLEDELYDMLLEIVASREKMGLGSIKLDVVRRGTES